MRDHITRHAFLATSTRSLGQLKCSRMSTFRQPASFEEDAIEALKHRIMHMKLAESDEFRVMSNGNVARAVRCCCHLFMLVSIMPSELAASRHFSPFRKFCVD